MRIEQLQYICEIADQKSISKAAKNLFISQPALSKAVAQLEDELGTPIFVRLQQGIIPTSLGEAIIIKARNILAEIDAIKELSVEKLSNNDADKFRIALPFLLCDGLFTEALDKVQQQFPALSIIPFQTSTLETLDGISNDSFDFGLVSFSNSEKDILENLTKEKNIYIKYLSLEPYYFVCSTNSKWSTYEQISCEDLSQVQLITFSDILRYSPITEFAFNVSNTEYAASKTQLFAHILKQEQSGTIIPRVGALNSNLSEKFSIIPISDFPNSQHIGFALNAKKAVTPYMQSFMDILSAFFQNYINSYNYS